MIRAIPTCSGDRVYCNILGQGAVHAVFAGYTGLSAHPSCRPMTCAPRRDRWTGQHAFCAAAHSDNHPGPTSGGSERTVVEQVTDAMSTRHVITSLSRLKTSICLPQLIRTDETHNSMDVQIPQFLGTLRLSSEALMPPTITLVASYCFLAR